MSTHTLQAVRLYAEAFEDLFAQCCSNPIKNAWGQEVNTTKLNAAHAFASRVLAGQEAAPKPPACAADDGWQPIETAPKDGRVLWLGYYNAHGNWRTLRGEWVSADQIAECWEEEAEPGWYETAVEAEDPPNAWATSPTHWRPLPKPPTDKGAPDA